jgi:hypothetical protein
MENFINSLPKPVLAILAILIGIAIFMVTSPPHTVCDTQADLLRESQKGVLFPTTIKKSKIPGVLSKAKETCQLGNSAGSCYEYFMLLRKLAEDIAKGSSECTGQVYEISEVAAALNDGLELAVRLAWGVKPPEPNADRFGWLQESEISTFCRMKAIYLRANGEEAWANFRKKISQKLPGEELKSSADTATPRSASALLSEQDIWNRSLFSVRCESF